MTAIYDFGALNVLQDVISIVSERAAAIMQRFGGSSKAGLSNARLLAALRALDEVDTHGHTGMHTTGAAHTRTNALAQSCMHTCQCTHIT